MSSTLQRRWSQILFGGALEEDVIQYTHIEARGILI